MPNLHSKPDASHFKKPVTWLFGRQLVANLKWIALYSAFKGKLDPRDWMHAEPYPSADDLRQTGAEPDRNGRFTQEDFDKFWKTQDGEFWFDYIADSGDGQKATYSIAYLCMSDLHVATPQNSLPSINTPVEFERQMAAHSAPGKLRLPRGRFLLVGGDTTYHIADYAGLAERFQGPFQWAADDLGLTDDDERRPLFGIPGNHDYYDIVDGFNRQFRAPTSKENEANQEGLYPLLSIPGLERCQQASYLALRLPFGWWLWGLDCEVGRLDIRQQEFFKNLAREFPPDKLILATPEPTTVAGKLARASSDPNTILNAAKTAQAFKDLGLERPFLQTGETLSPDKIRLDISGDTHHYERYWGPDSNQLPDSDRTPHLQPPSGNNYASVVSGIGGAFLHPTQTYFREVARQTLYPSKKDSRNETAQQIFNHWKLIQGGYVWLFGIILALIVYVSGTFLRSTGVVFDLILGKVLRIPLPGMIGGSGSSVSRDGFAGFFANLGAIAQHVSQNAGLTPGGFALRVASLLLSIIALVLALRYSKWLFALRIADPPARGKEEPRKKTASKPPDGNRGVVSPVDEYKPRTLKANDFVALGALVVFAILSFSFGIWHFVEYRRRLPQFGCSLLVLVCIVWAVAAIIESLLYSEWLFKLAYKWPVKLRHYAPLWGLTVSAVGILMFGVWVFGIYPAKFLIADLIFAAVVLGGVAGLVALGYQVAGEMSGTRGKFGFAALGAWHALLQLAVPFFLVSIGDWRALVGAVLLIALFRWIGISLVRWEARWLLVLAWLCYGGLMLYLPIKFNGPLIPFTAGLWQPVLSVLLAGLSGMVLTCVWLGWYFAVSLAFDGHNNEAAGAATIERFKQIIRFKLTDQELIGFVIAVDDPVTDGQQLKPKIVDVFRLARQQP